MASETSAQSVQAQFEAANEQFNALQRELSTFITARQQLEAQLQENKIVQEVCEFQPVRMETCFLMPGIFTAV